MTGGNCHCEGIYARGNLMHENGYPRNKNNNANQKKLPRKSAGEFFGAPVKKIYKKLLTSRIICSIIYMSND